MREIFLILAGLLAVATATSDKVVCYFGSWAIYRHGNGKFDIGKIDPNLCTHLIYTFVGLNADATVKVLDPWADLAKDYALNGYGKINDLRKTNPNLKTLIAMGGWNEGEKNAMYSQIMGNPNSRSKLVGSIVRFVEEHGFDGFDLDWEYPGPARAGGVPQDKANLILFLKELKAAFQPKGLLISAAVGAPENIASSAYNVAEMSKLVDMINLMCYDFHGAWDKQTGHNAPLYAASWETGNTKRFNVDAAIQYWIKQGAQPEKLVMGIPFYARGFTLANPSNNGVNAPAIGDGCTAGPYTKVSGMLGYNEICEKSNQWKVKFDEEQRVPYAVNGNQWVSFDNERSIAEKADYVKKYGLGGMMVWSIETDDFGGVCGESWPLLRAVNEALKGNGIKVQAPNSEEKPKSNQQIIPHSSVTVTEPTSTESTCFEATSTKETTPLVPAQQNNNNNNNDDPETKCQNGGYARDPENCNSFYQCVWTGSSYTPVQMSCPPNLYFSESISVCNWPDQVPECHNNNNNNDDPETKCQNGGYARDPENCNSFYQCVWTGSSYTPVQMSCPPTLYFSESISVCNWPDQVPECQ